MQNEQNNSEFIDVNSIAEKSKNYYEITKKIIEKAPRILKYIEELYGLQNTNPEKLECMGNYFFYNDNKEEAVKYYLEANKFKANYYCARYHYMIARKREVEENYVEAVKYYCSAIEIEPPFIDAYIDFGAMLIKIEDYATAEMLFQDALRIDEMERSIYLNLISLYELLLKKGEKKLYSKLKDIELKYNQLFGELK